MNAIQSDRAETASDSNKNAKEKRTPRAIRFSKSEWTSIRSAATRRGISFASFVREAAMMHATAETPGEPVEFPPEYLQLMRQTFRYTFTLATLKRNELIRAGRQEDVNQAVEFAKIAESELLSDSSSS